MVHSHLCSWDLPSQLVYRFPVAKSGPIPPGGHRQVTLLGSHFKGIIVQYLFHTFFCLYVVNKWKCMLISIPEAFRSYWNIVKLLKFGPLGLPEVQCCQCLYSESLWKSFQLSLCLLRCLGFYVHIVALCCVSCRRRTRVAHKAKWRVSAIHQKAAWIQILVSNLHITHTLQSLIGHDIN